MEKHDDYSYRDFGRMKFLVVVRCSSLVVVEHISVASVVDMLHMMLDLTCYQIEVHHVGVR